MKLINVKIEVPEDDCSKCFYYEECRYDPKGEWQPNCRLFDMLIKNNKRCANCKNAEETK